MENCSYTFRSDGSREVYADKFTYFGFRYLELDGYPGSVPSPDDITCYFTHTDLERSSTLEFLSPVASEENHDEENRAVLLNQIQRMITHSALSNYVSHPDRLPVKGKARLDW